MFSLLIHLLTYSIVYFVALCYLDVHCGRERALRVCVNILEDCNLPLLSMSSSVVVWRPLLF